MRRFTIVPADQSPSAAVIVVDACSVLQIVNRLRYTDADVLEDGKYAFSVHAAKGAFWTIFRRDCEEPDQIPELGRPKEILAKAGPVASASP